ncbi:MAG: DEAD/DEAH box helicase [Methanomicrobiales archaeon]|nr:DEAD/DEAH box helicase [Methanomicrobiales archaeon]
MRMNIPQPFLDLNISPDILRSIGDMGFEEPTPIQQLAIPHLLDGKDVTGQAQTGTGKTAAFGIPAIQLVDAQNSAPQVLILSPTRELAIQTAEELTRLARYSPKIHILPIYGGQPIERQFRALKAGAQIIVGTPGRLLDHLDRGTLSLDAVRMVVLDEADVMLDMGFREDIEAILGEIPRQRQTVLFSATLPGPILEISRRFQKNPQLVKVPQRELTVPRIEQLYLEVRNRDKPEILCRLLDIYNPRRSLVFCNTKKGVDELTAHLHTRGYGADGLHGDLKQIQRDRVMAAFRSGATDVLVATDVAARGIDVEDVDLVVNFDVPQDVEYYIHRIGRTARAGREGRSITFVGPREIFKLKTIQKYAKITIARIPLPTADDVEEIRLQNMIASVRQAVEAGIPARYMTVIERMMAGDITSLEIAAALLQRAMETGPESEPAAGIPAPRGEPGMVRLVLNAGRDKNIRPKDIVGAITGETGVSGSAIGAITIAANRTVIDVAEASAAKIVEGMAEKSVGSLRLTDGYAIRYAD